MDNDSLVLKLKVIQLLPALNAGGVERGTIEVAGELSRRGHQAVVVSAGGRLLDELEENGAEHICLDIGKKSPASLLLVKKLRGLFQRSNANIIHARSRMPTWLAYLAWRKMDEDSRPRFITSVHGPYSANAYSKIMTRGERVIAISDFIREYISTNYRDVDMHKVSVIPRGIHPELYPRGYKPAQKWLEQWHKQYPQLLNACVITLPARITRWKGQEDFINIIGNLNKMNVEVYGVIAGGVETRRRSFQDELTNLVQARGLDKKIIFTGHRNDLREVMSVSNLIMSLARSPEAFGRTALEALGLGVPVIAYDHGGASEVLKNIFPTGLVPALDQAAATNRALEFILHPPKLIKDNPFTLNRMLDSTLGLYEELAATQTT
jgi:glycosyltransferase involved in cell wall biosynthesis